MGIFENKRIEYEEFSLGEGEHSVKAAVVSDLHFPRQRADTSSLPAELEERGVDVVFLTGDLVWRKADLSACGAREFLEALCAVMPVFYAEGNHEYRHREAALIPALVRECGVHDVTGKCVSASIGGADLLIAGDSEQNGSPRFEGKGVKILLAHHPERARDHAQILRPDYIFSGHAHGGQFRLFGRGLYAPDQGLFPKYTSGLYPIAEGTDLVVSRGIGRSRFPFRINDPPHVPIVTISV